MGSLEIKRSLLVNQLNHVRDNIQAKMRQVKVLKLECPKCGTRQASSTCRTKVCIRCGMSFEIFTKARGSRIHDCEEMINKGPLIRGLSHWMIVERELQQQIRDNESKMYVRENEYSKLKKRHGE